MLAIFAREEREIGPGGLFKTRIHVLERGVSHRMLGEACRRNLAEVSSSRHGTTRAAEKNTLEVGAFFIGHLVELEMKSEFSLPGYGNEVGLFFA